MHRGRHGSKPIRLLAQRDQHAVVAREPNPQTHAVPGCRIIRDRCDLPRPGIQKIWLSATLQAELPFHRFTGRRFEQRPRLIRRADHALVVEEIVIGPRRRIPPPDTEHGRRRARVRRRPDPAFPQLARHIGLMRHPRNRALAQQFRDHAAQRGVRLRCVARRSVGRRSHHNHRQPRPRIPQDLSRHLDRHGSLHRIRRRPLLTVENQRFVSRPVRGQPVPRHRGVRQLQHGGIQIIPRVTGLPQFRIAPCPVLETLRRRIQIVLHVDGDVRLRVALRQRLLIPSDVIVVSPRIRPERIARPPRVRKPRLPEVVIAGPLPRCAFRMRINVINQLRDAPGETPVHADNRILECLRVRLTQRRAAFRRIPGISRHMIRRRHRQIIVHLVADEQVFVLGPVHRRRGLHHVGDRRGHARLALHLHE